MNAKLVSVNIGKPKELTWKEKRFESGIYKLPVLGKVYASKFNLEGDGQANLNVHGGVDKAIYVYPYEHYEYWKNKFPNIDFTIGVFGENFTISGLDEFNVNIGDRFKIGEIEVEVSEPRFPCFKLGARIGTAKFIKPFLNSFKTGFYLRVLKEGYVSTESEIKIMTKDMNELKVADFVKLYLDQKDEGLLRRALKVNAISEKWRKKFDNYLLELKQ